METTEKSGLISSMESPKGNHLCRTNEASRSLTVFSLSKLILYLEIMKLLMDQAGLSGI